MQTTNKNSQILLYNYNTDFNDSVFDGVTVVSSPATCLRTVTLHAYALIVILQKFRSLKERFALIELCSTLKNNHFSRHIPLLCLLPAKHRGLLEQLHNVGTEYARFYDSNDANSTDHLKDLLAKPSEDYTIKKILAGICPHINYFPISRQQEIMYCGAYRNRLVLGSHRLNHFCETIHHKECQYFKCPKFF